MKLSTIIKTGLLVGTLDIIAALTQFYIKTGRDPELVLKYIASAVFGKEEAYNSGRMMSLYGLLFHYIIAFSFTIFFFWIYSKLKFLAANKVLTAIGYGVFMWCVTQFVVFPFTKLSQPVYTFSGVAIAISILIVCISIPLALIAKSNTDKH